MGFPRFSDLIFALHNWRNFRTLHGVARVDPAQKREATLVLSRPINVLAAFAAFAFVGAVLLGMF